ncbi:unnamed protein product, partial [Tetraodon nigroviridis]
MNCELLATCSALGYLEGDTYHKEPDCLESVKDLIRYLRYEDDSRDVRQQLGAAQIVQNDLLPLIIQHGQDKTLFDACIRLMVNLTQPAMLCFGKVPDDPVFRQHFLEVTSHLQAYKETFASEKVFGILSETLYSLLQLDWEQRQEEDNLLIERILLLVRNVLHVPADPCEEKKVDDDASVHDRLLWAIHISGFDDLVKFLASAQSEKQWSLHILEIITLMFRDQTPDALVSAGQSRSTEEKLRDSQELESLRQKEHAAKRSRTFQRGTRHSRFGGSYVVQGLRSIGENDLIYHRNLHHVSSDLLQFKKHRRLGKEKMLPSLFFFSKFKNYTHDTGKTVRRVPKRYRQAQECKDQRRSALNVRLFLREFCVDFLENCYNHLMYLVKERLIREQTEEHDETYYLWALSFFMAFNRGNGFHTDLVSETMSIRTFHFIERNLMKYYEMILTDRKEATSWSRRMHLALKAYQELLLNLNEMDHSQDENIRQSSNIIKSNIFYMMEYREIFLTLLRKYDETKQPQSYLQDLVESTHLFLRMLERFCTGRKNLMVQRKRVKRRKRRGRRTTHTHKYETHRVRKANQELRNTNQLYLFCCVLYQLSASVTEVSVPFDATSETPLEEQRTEAMVRVQDALVARLGPEALGLLRAAREVWPEGDVFGSADVEPDEELELLKQILHADLPRTTAEPAPEEEEEEDAAELEEEELESVQVSESEFNFLDFIKRFANPAIVRPYILLLKTYSKNTPHTNHCIARMLHRLAVNLKMDALLFQLSVFSVFNKILNDPAAAAYTELVTFAKFVLKRFFALAAQNSKAYIELLFWKNVGAVREMTEGYSKDGARYRGDSAAVAEQHQPHSAPGRDPVSAHGAGGYCKGPEETKVCIFLRRTFVCSANLSFFFFGSRFFTKEKVLGLFFGPKNKNRSWRCSTKSSRTPTVGGKWSSGVPVQQSDGRLVFHRYTGEHPEEDHSQAFPRASGGQAAQHGSGVRETRALQEEESRLSGEERREGNDGSVGEDEEEDESDESEEERDEEQEQSHNGGRRRSLQLPAGRRVDVASMVSALQQEGMSGPLLWLQNCLYRTAEDREEDGFSQAVPLLPLSEANEEAMETRSFQKLLRKIGIRAPANEQEIFWRIPAKISASQLRSAAAALTPEPEGPGGDDKQRDCGTGESQAEDEEEQEEEEEEAEGEQRAQALRALLLARKRK